MTGQVIGLERVFGVILAPALAGASRSTGPPGITGEWRRNLLPWPTAEERAFAEVILGKSGCIETFPSAPDLLPE